MNKHIGESCERGRLLFKTHRIEDVELVRCKLKLGGLGYNHNSSFNKLDVVRNSHASDCSIENGSIGPALLSHVVIDNLRGDVICWGAFFEVVTLIGDFDNIFLQGIPLGMGSAQVIERHRSARNAFYQKVENALDISRMNCKSFSMRNGAVPLKLITRDGASQFIISDTLLLKADKKWDEGLSVFTSAVVKSMRKENREETLLVAPKRDRETFDSVMSDIDLISRRTGVRFFD